MSNEQIPSNTKLFTSEHSTDFSAYQQLVLTLLERVERELQELKLKEINDIAEVQQEIEILRRDITHLKTLLDKQIEDILKQGKIDILEHLLKNAQSKITETQKAKDTAYTSGVKQGELVQKVDSGLNLRLALRASLFGLSFTTAGALLNLLFHALGWPSLF